MESYERWWDLNLRSGRLRSNRCGYLGDHIECWVSLVLG